MAGRILMSKRFAEWYDRELEPFQRGLADYSIGLLRENPFNLGHPYASQIEGRIRELRVRNVRNPLRIFYALDAERDVILLCGGNKRGLDGQYARRFADDMARVALKEFSEHLLDPRFAISFTPTGPKMTATEAEAEDTQPAARSRKTHDPRKAPPGKYGEKHWPRGLVDRIVAHTGWDRGDVVRAVQPGGHLDPNNPDSERIVEEIFATHFTRHDGGDGHVSSLGAFLGFH